MNEQEKKEYLRLKAKEEKRRAYQNARRVRNIAKMHFLEDYFKSNAKEADKQALAKAVSEAI